MKVVIIDPSDDVGVSIEPIAKGECVSLPQEHGMLTALEDIPLYHKLALRDMPAGHKVRKYGEHIGETVCSILRGSHVHVHNVCGVREDLDNKQ